ncbi:MAG: hypothetical protein ABFS38_01805 [Bacteroidota bacterium]
MKILRFYLWILLAVMISSSMDMIAQESDYRPGLLFREEWKEIPAETPVTQNHISNPDLILRLYGPGKDSIKKSHHDNPADDPYYIWSGLCPGNWALTLKHRKYHMDLSGFAKIKWRTKQFGFRELHILLKLADGSWLVSRQGDPASADWREREFNLQDLEWYTIHMESITEQAPVTDPDLTEVLEIGFTDLMPGGKSAACSRLDWIEVYGYPVAGNPN